MPDPGPPSPSRSPLPSFASPLSSSASRPPRSVLNVAQMLQQSGYATAGVGKLAPLAAPMAQGFDYFIGQVDQALCHK